MEIIVFLLLFWLFSRLFRRRRKEPLDKWAAFEEAARKNEKQQRRYDNYMMSLPELAGDGTYSQRIRGELAYRDTLDNMGEWMERYHPGKDEINVIVERITSKDGKEHSVRIEAGNAVLGFIPREIAGKFGNELKELGGVARASAKFKWSPHDGQSTITLDVVRPLRLV